MTVSALSVIVDKNIVISSKLGVVQTALFFYTGKKMEYTPLESQPYYSECKGLVEGLGYRLVDFSLARIKTGWHAQAVIFSPDGIGIDDCTKVHKPLQQKLEVLLNSQDVFMEVSSPGVQRVLKKTYELEAFVGEQISVWDSDCTDWLSGKLTAYTDAGIVLETKNGNKEISFENCKKAKLEY